MREIIEQPAVQKALDDARDRWSRTDDAWMALTWVLARDPEAGEPLTESGRTRSLVYHGARSNETPTIEATYEIAEKHIIVHEAIFSVAKDMNASTSVATVTLVELLDDPGPHFDVPEDDFG